MDSISVGPTPNPLIYILFSRDFPRERWTPALGVVTVIQILERLLSHFGLGRELFPCPAVTLFPHDLQLQPLHSALSQLLSSCGD